MKTNPMPRTTQVVVLNETDLPVFRVGWGDWSACSATCSHGWQQRTRVCLSRDYYNSCGVRKASCGLIPCDGE